jgi:hypothetical protein
LPTTTDQISDAKWRKVFICLGLGIAAVAALPSLGQVDPKSRNQLQLGYDYPLTGRGPQALYAYYYLNVPQLTGSNTALRLAIAPAYLDGELGIRLTPNTALGVGFAGGAFGDYFYEVRQGHYFRSESFYGHGGGGAFSFYQLLNPGRRVPLNLVARAGARYSTYLEADDTASDFELPDDRVNLYTRAGLRFGGKEPGLYPELGLELSAWFERGWRLHSDLYGFDNDRRVNPVSNLYWIYAGFNYAWTNTGHILDVDITAGGSDDADRFSAWRLGGVLPLVAEFPLILPGYYFQEISARRFLHLQASYGICLDPKNQWCIRLEAASAKVDYLPGFEQSADWNTGIGGGLVYTSKNKTVKVAVRYGYGFNALRDGEEGAHSVGILFQYDFEARMRHRYQY